jgi:hypothetical protein
VLYQTTWDFSNLMITKVPANQKEEKNELGLKFNISTGALELGKTEDVIKLKRQSGCNCSLKKRYVERVPMDIAASAPFVPSELEAVLVLVLLLAIFL